MAYIFDSLGYAKRLRDGGVPRDQAEAHAEAARDFIMVELATKADVLALRADLLAVKQELLAEFRVGITELEGKLRGTITDVEGKLRGTITEVEGKLQGSINELRANVADLRSTVDTLSLRLTVRLGAMIVVAIGALAAIMKLG